MKICSTCKTEEQKENFHKNKQNKDGLHNICKNCCKEYSKEYRKENKEKLREKRKDYIKENYHKIRNSQKEYYKVNSLKICKLRKEYKKENRLKINQYHRERRKTDPNFRIACNLRRSTNRGIFGQDGVKSASSQELLGCTWMEGRIHIENQFLLGMTWENHGEWEIDHIRPMVSFDLTDPEQQKLCCHYSNLRPLWAKENSSKGSLFNGIRYRQEKI